MACNNQILDMTDIIFIHNFVVYYRMRTYKRKTERGKISKDTYEQAVVILEEESMKKVRGMAKNFSLCYMLLIRYVKKRREAKEKVTMESLTVGYQKRINNY